MSGGAGTVVVRNYEDGHLGVVLSSNSPPQSNQFVADDEDNLILDFNNGTTIEQYNGGIEQQSVTFSGQVERIEAKGGNDTVQIDADISGFVIFGDSAGAAPSLDGDDFIEIDRINGAADNIPPDSLVGGVIYGEGGDD